MLCFFHSATHHASCDSELILIESIVSKMLSLGIVSTQRKTPYGKLQLDLESHQQLLHDDFMVGCHGALLGSGTTSWHLWKKKFSAMSFLLMLTVDFLSRLPSYAAGLLRYCNTMTLLHAH
jgi:hypothetical protein